MDKSNLELFKQALSEGLSNKIDSVIDSYTEEIVCSERHNVAMREILYGKNNTKKTRSLRARRVIAILVAAALLLASCAIVYRNEIRDFVENVYEFFAKVSYSDEEANGIKIDEVYELTYVPEGYYLENERILDISVCYIYASSNGDEIWFEQSNLDGTNYFIDLESGYTRIVEIQKYDIYYKFADEYHYYLWNDGKYSMKLKAHEKLSNNEIESILDGIKTK